MDMIPTRYGPLPSAGLVDRHPDGQARALFMDGPVILATSLGELCPQHTIDDARRLALSPVTFHPNGQVRSLPLERRTRVATPAGTLPAELVTFHENGAVARVFPLDGKLSGYWSEADEARLAEPLTVPTPFGPVTARFVAVAFDTAGRLRSLTLWPEEVVLIATPVGQVPTRLGLSLYPDGSLKSLEPARPCEVPTPVGPVRAFDPDAVGISGDDNSLAFAPDGEIVRIATVGTVVTARLADGSSRVLAPGVRESLCGDGDREAVPLLLEFLSDRVEARVTSGQPPVRVPRAGTRFSTRPHVAAFDVPFSPRRCAV